MAESVSSAASLSCYYPIPVVSRLSFLGQHTGRQDMAACPRGSVEHAPGCCKDVSLAKKPDAFDCLLVFLRENMGRTGM